MVLDLIGAGLIALGLLLATIGLYGLLRLPDIFHQLHPAGLVTGPAVILVLLAAVAIGSAEIITSAALVLLFVLVTSPLSTHAIAQAARRRPRRPQPDPASPAE
jgi:multicomponent Na+:H+ antiporter subunit G